MLATDTESPLLEALDVSVPGVARARALLTGPQSLRLMQGDAVALTGVSGSGKSTLLRVLGLLEPRALGKIRYRGEALRPADVPAFRRAVQYLPQSPVRLPGSLLKNLAAPFHFESAHGQTLNEARARELCAQLGLDQAVLDTDARELSGGEAQRMAIIRALLLEPEALLLDEPTTGLDQRAQDAVELAIQVWQRARPSRALLLVSHNTAQRARLTRRQVQLPEPDLRAAT